MAYNKSKETLMKLKDEISEPLKEMNAALADNQKAAENAAEGLEKVGEAAEKAGRKAEGAKVEFDNLKETFEKFKILMESYLMLEIANEFIKTASAVENYRIQLGSVLNSQQAGNEKLEEFENIIKNTPIQMSDLVQAHKSLVTNGINLTSKSLESMGLQALASGHKMGEIAYVLNSIQIAGGINTRVIRGMSEAGINYNQIFKDVDITTLSAAEAIKIITEYMNIHAANNMDKIGHSWTGIVGTMKNQWEVFQNDLMNSGLFETLKNGIQDLSKTIKENEAEIQKAGSALGEYFTFLINFDKLASVPLRAVGSWFVSIEERILGTKILMEVLNRKIKATADSLYALLSSPIRDILHPIKTLKGEFTKVDVQVNKETPKIKDEEYDTVDESRAKAKKLTDEQAAIEKQLNDLTKSRDNLTKELTESLKDQKREQEGLFKSYEKGAKDAEEAIKKIDAEIKKINEDEIQINAKWADYQTNLSTKIRKLDDKSKTPEQIQSDTLGDIHTKMQKLSGMSILNKNDLDTAIKLSKELETEASEIIDIKKQREILVNLQTNGKTLQEAEIKLDEEKKKQLGEQKKQQEENLKKMNDLAGKQAEILNGIEKKISELTAKPALVKVEADITEADKKIQELKDKLAKLGGAASPASPAPAGLTETHAAGGLVAGKIGIAGQGEYVINRAATHNWGTNFLSSLNSLKMPNITPKLPKGLGGGNVAIFELNGKQFPALVSDSVFQALKSQFKAKKMAGSNISASEFLNQELNS